MNRQLPRLSLFLRPLACFPVYLATITAADLCHWLLQISTREEMYINDFLAELSNPRIESQRRGIAGAKRTHVQTFICARGFFITVLPSGGKIAIYFLQLYLFELSSPRRARIAGTMISRVEIATNFFQRDIFPSAWFRVIRLSLEKWNLSSSQPF